VQAGTPALPIFGKMKILFVTPVIPTQTDGRRPYNYLKYLSKRHDVRLITMKLPEQTEDDAQHIREMGVPTTTIDIIPFRSCMKSVIGLLRGDPLRVSWCRYEEMRTAIRQALNQDHFDIAHFDRMRMGQFAQGIPCPTLIDFTDSLVMYFQRTLRHRQKFFEWCIDRWELATIPRFERNVLPFFDAAIVCSLIDADVFHRYHPEYEFEVIANGVDLQQFSPKSHPAGHAPRCVITGTLFYFPNIDSIRFYRESILPDIRRRFPWIETDVIGTRPIREMQNLDGRDGIHILSDVPRMEDHLYQDDIYLCPLRVAAGIRNKILEAMAAGMPIITTRLGTEGLELKHEKEVLFAETGREFAEQIEQLIQTPELGRQLGKNARAYVEERHRFDVLGAKLENLYERLITRSKSS